MKTILVDAINAFIIKEEELNREMYKLLESYPNKKIILTGANKEQQEKYGFQRLPYDFFTLNHNPDKQDPTYFKIMLNELGLSKDDVIYFEHNQEAVESARSVGINTMYYDKDKRDIKELQKFIDNNL